MKKFLFIGVGFHIYDYLIVKELERSYDVSYINVNSYKKEHPKQLSFYQRLGMNDKAVRNFERRIQQDIDSLANIKFDIIFVIKGEYLSESNMRSLKQNNPQSRYVLYLWDSWKNIDNREVLLKYFKGDIFSFDSVDSKDYGFKLRPLFYIPAETSDERIIDISFVGVNHSRRYEWLSNLKQIAKSNNLIYFIYLNVGYFNYYKNLYLTHRYKMDDIDILKKEILPFVEYQRVSLSSRIVLDYPNDNQTGLTMRTIESLGMGARLITTNKYIKEYSDIPNDLYLVITRDNIDVSKVVEFIKKNSSNKLPPRYTIAGFLEELYLI